jgi:hypothetical protein
VAVGDFNGDGTPDLAVANVGSNTVSVLLGQGDGTFLPAQSYAAGSYPLSVAVGDFNGDGIPDLAVANQGTYPSYNDSSVSVLLGQGDGTFLPAVNYPGGAGRRSVAVGDFNGDGKLDLAVAGYGRYQDDYGYWHNADETVRVLLGQGDGTFLPAQAFPAGYSPQSVAVGDFNGDGKQDLAVANYTINGTVSVLLGKGDATFLPAQAFPVGSSPRSVAVGDFNGDGKLDLAVANLGTFPSYNGGVSVLLGQGDGTLLPAVNYAAGIQPESVAVGDFNGDGIPDLAVAHLGTYPSYSDSGVSILLGKGDGTFLPAVNYAAGSGPVSVAVGDFNCDGWPDLAVANVISNDVSILLNDATWPGGPSRARAGLSHPSVPEPLPPPAVRPFPNQEEPPLAAIALLTLPPAPGNGPVLTPPAPRALPGADPPQTALLPVLLAEGRPSVLADPRAGPRAWGAPGGPSIPCSPSWPPKASGTIGPTKACRCWRERRLRPGDHSRSGHGTPPTFAARARLSAGELAGGSINSSRFYVRSVGSAALRQEEFGRVGLGYPVTRWPGGQVTRLQGATERKTMT